MKIGDLVQYRGERVGVVVSEVFDMRPTWNESHPAVQVRTQHGLTGEDGVWGWLLEDIKVVSKVKVKNS